MAAMITGNREGIRRSIAVAAASGAGREHVRRKVRMREVGSLIIDSHDNFGAAGSIIIPYVLDIDVYAGLVAASLRAVIDHAPLVGEVRIVESSGSDGGHILDEIDAVDALELEPSLGERLALVKIDIVPIVEAPALVAFCEFLISKREDLAEACYAEFIYGGIQAHGLGHDLSFVKVGGYAGGHLVGKTDNLHSGYAKQTSFADFGGLNAVISDRFHRLRFFFRTGCESQQRKKDKTVFFHFDIIL